MEFQILLPYVKELTIIFQAWYQRKNGEEKEGNTRYRIFKMKELWSKIKPVNNSCVSNKSPFFFHHLENFSRIWNEN